MSSEYKTTRSQLFSLNAFSEAPDPVRPYTERAYEWELCGQCAVARSQDFGIIFWTWRRPTLAPMGC